MQHLLQQSYQVGMSLLKTKAYLPGREQLSKFNSPIPPISRPLPLMRKSKSSSIINIISTYGFLGPNWDLYKGTKMGNPAAYAASKGGLLQLTRWLSTTLAPNIRVNSISPGGILEIKIKNLLKSTLKKHQ